MTAPEDLTPRRGDPELAGTFCATCQNYARYAVTCITDSKTGQLAKPAGTCAQHLAISIRQLWDRYHLAAIVQEIPGAWRRRGGTE